MRCDDCLPLIEEYFDGEVDERTNEQIEAHLSTCADCSAALDSLSFEQEIFSRYDRGLEVSPTLWSRVSAEIAREPQAEVRDAKRPFLSRALEGLAAALAALTARPALASSLALLFVGVTAGSLWLAHVRKAVETDKAGGGLTAQAVVNPSPDAPAPVVAGPVEGLKATPATNEHVNVNQGGVEGFEVASSNGVGRRVVAIRDSGHKSSSDEEDIYQLLNSSPPANSLNKGTVKIEEHTATDSNPVVFEDTNYRADDVTTTSARLLDPEQKELARHVEQAQMLLRSIKNARPSDEGSVNVSYEKKLSRKLLAENTTLKLDAETRGDKDSKQVLDQIEPFLLDIANLRDDASREDVRSVKERVKKTEIIASLQVY